MRDDIELAKEIRKNAYTPYSDFQVGAVLRTKDGKVYTGVNVENDGIQSICAERTAFVKAISEGEREFESVAVVGCKKGEEIKKECLPCGYCRQFMSEFVDSDFKIYTFDGKDIICYNISDLLPYGFNLKNKK